MRRTWFLPLLFGLTSIFGCQQCIGLTPGTPRGEGGGGFGGASSGTTSTTSSSTSSGTGGASSSSTTSTTSSSGAGGAGGAGGMGGASSSSTTSTSSTTSSSGAGGMSGDAGTDAGDSGVTDGGDAGDDGGADAGPTGTVVLLAGGGQKILAASFQPASGWTATSLNDKTDAGFGPSITLTPSNVGVGAIRSSPSQELRFVTWSSGAWSGDPALVMAAVTTRARPMINAASARAQLVLQGLDFKYYYTAFNTSAMTWSAVEQVSNGTQSFGPSSADVAARADDATVIFLDGFNGTNNPVAQDRVAGAWSAKATVDTNVNSGAANLYPMPAILTLNAAGDVMVAYVKRSDTKVYTSIRANNVWSPVTAVLNFTTLCRAELALGADGAPVLAIHGTDHKPYFARWNAGNAAWENIAPPAVNLLTSVCANPPSAAVNGSSSAIALAPGVGGVRFEVAYVEASSQVFHLRHDGIDWIPAVLVSDPNVTGVTDVAIASRP